LKKIFTALYLLLLLAHVLAGELQWQEVEFITKPFLVLSLLVIFLFYQRKYGANRFSRFISLGLFFCLAGDILLMFQDFGDYFVYGLSAFLIGHIFYILAFFRTNLENHEIPLIKKQGWVMVLIVAYGYLFFQQIKDHLGEMIGPVIVYTMVITLMLLIAANRYKKVSPQSFRYIFFGAMLFVASDSILAWNKFVHQIDFSHALIMSTYGLAQLFITTGAILQLKDQA